MKTKNLTLAGIIAALYIALTYVSASMGLASGAIQVRLSEVLTVLPYFTPAAIPGLFIGCFLANLLTGSVILDVIFGSLATLLAAVLTYYISRKNKWLAAIPPIVINAVVVGLIIRYLYKVPEGILYLMGTVGIGEVISAGIIGTLVLVALEKKMPGKGN